MPPLAPPHGEKSCSGGGRGRQRQEPGGAWQRSASFHGRGAEQRLSPKPRPKTQPDLLAGVRGRSFCPPAGGSRGPLPAAVAAAAAESGVRTPSKVLMSVTVQRSMWPLHVMASAEWSVADLMAAAVGLYVKEGRRPPLPSADPAAFGLHYSQFSLESLEPSEKVMELGSRSFFLCSKSPALDQAASSSSSDGANMAISKASGKSSAWLSYTQFWPMM